MKAKKWEELKPPQKKIIANYFGWETSNNYRTFDNWAKKPKRKRLIDLMVKDFYQNKVDLDGEIKKLEKEAVAGSYYLLPKIGELEVINETSIFWDDAQIERRDKLFSIRNTIYGSEL